MAEVTIMVLKLKVDLGCDCCYRKVKKLLCKFPEIQDWTFCEKENEVRIKVVCCCPEKIRMKIICKGRETIKCIKVVTPPPPPPPPPVTGYPLLICPTGVCCKPCYEGRGGGPCHHGYEIPYKPPSYEGYVKLVPSNDGWPSGCRCNRSYGCRCEYFIQENPTCTIM